MKRFLLIMAMILPFVGWSQTKVSINKDNTDICIVKNATCPIGIKSSNVKDWAIKTFNDYKDVVQYADVNKIVIKAGIVCEQHKTEVPNYTYISTPTVLFTMTIDLKPTRYRITLSNLSVKEKIYSKMLLGYDYDVTNEINDRTIADFCYTGPKAQQNERIDAIENALSNMLESLNENICKKDDW